MAKELFITSTTLSANNPQSHRHLGLAYYALNEKNAAIDSFERVLQLEPDNFETLLDLGHINKADSQYEAAVKFYKRALSANTSSPEPYAELAEILDMQFDYTQAIDLAETALRLQPDNIKALQTLTNAYRCIGLPEKAIHLGKKLIRLVPNDSQSNISLARAYVEYGDHVSGSSYAKKAIKLDDSIPEAYAIYSLSITRSGRWEEALENINRALELLPDDDRFTAQKASLLQFLGHNKEAFDLVAPFIHKKTRISTDCLQLYMKGAKRYGKEKNALKLAEKALSIKELPQIIRLALSFSTAELYDSLGKYDKAFKHFKNGNDLKHLVYNRQDHEEKIRRLIENFPASFFNNLRQIDHINRRPIFIVGMPRSGTSLTEKILASHSGVFGADELNKIRDICYDLPKITGNPQIGYPECIHSLNETSLERAAKIYLDFLDTIDHGKHYFITDKMPQNFNHIGIIAALFPESPIIHCKRNALDTCLSCYFQNFAAAGLEFTYNLSDLGHYYRWYIKTMNHWHDVLPGRIYNLTYESLVENSEAEIRKLIDFCGITWEDALLSHHKSTHVTKTASYDQVRQPIYTKSSGRWKNYKSHLQPLIQELEF